MTQLVDARSALQARGFDEIPAARLTDILNQAKDQFEDAFTSPPPWLEGTQSGTAPMTFTDLKEILYVADTSNQNELRGVPAQQIIAEMDTIIGDAGTPAVWWLDWSGSSAVLKVHPTSTTVQLSVRYVKESPVLSADADTPLIPARYHSTWIDLAAVRCYLDGDNPGDAAQLAAIANQDLARIASRYETRDRQNGSYQQILGYAGDW